MNVGIVRKIASAHPLASIDEAITAFERDRSNPLQVEGKDDAEVMSHLLAAQFVRRRMDQGQDINAAFREYAQRVKGMLSKPAGR
jgi:hypothetical protein